MVALNQSVKKQRKPCFYNVQVVPLNQSQNSVQQVQNSRGVLSWGILSDNLWLWVMEGCVHLQYLCHLPHRLLYCVKRSNDQGGSGLVLTFWVNEPSVMANAWNTMEWAVCTYGLTLRVRPSSGSWGSVIVHCKVEKGGRKWTALAFTCILHPPALPSSCGSSLTSALCQSCYRAKHGQQFAGSQVFRGEET